MAYADDLVAMTKTEDNNWKVFEKYNRFITNETKIKIMKLKRPEAQQINKMNIRTIYSE